MGLITGPLGAIQRLIPHLAGKAEHTQYKALLKDANKRDDALFKKLQALNNKGVDPSSDRWVDLDRQRNPVSIARDNLTTAVYAAPHDTDARLLLATTPDAQRHAGSMLYRPQYYQGERGLPDNGVYIEGLSSELAGGGTQLLKELEAMYRGLPMYLESVANPETLNFYAKKGFVPQRDGSSDIIPNRLLIKPAHVQVKKRGGLVRMAQHCRAKGAVR